MPRGSRHLLVALAALVAAVGPIGCGSDDDAPSSSTSEIDAGVLPIEGAVDRRGQVAVTIDVSDNVFEPRVVRVDPGVTVTWTNTGLNPHNVIPADQDRFEPVATGSLEPRGSASRTFAAPGVYRYFCSIHGTATRGQRGVIVVGDAGL